jgi:O-acetylserine/cysteine efflux transporter
VALTPSRSACYTDASVRPRDVVLAVVVAVLWGVAFVATRLGLDDFSPSQLTALRFVIAALPALVLPRPPIGWPALAAVGLTLFAGQFLFQFFGIAQGTPVGIAAVVVHAQALFTIAFAAALLGERPTSRQWLGSAVALSGLAVIAATVGGDLTARGFLLTLLSPVSFGVGNVLLKRLDRADMPSLVAWLSLVPPVPALALSAALDGPGALPRALAGGRWSGVAAVLYLGLVATTLAYAIWGALLRRYPAATVAPFALLVPLVGAAASALMFGERFGPVRLIGMAVLLLGLAVIVAPARVGATAAVGDTEARRDSR